jgi:hypothetical protein
MFSCVVNDRITRNLAIHTQPPSHSHLHPHPISELARRRGDIANHARTIVAVVGWTPRHQVVPFHRKWPSARPSIGSPLSLGSSSRVATTYITFRCSSRTRQNPDEPSSKLHKQLLAHALFVWQLAGASKATIAQTIP